MENREENLKKINGQFEQMSDEQLERIAGGNSFEDKIKQFWHWITR